MNPDHGLRAHTLLKSSHAHTRARAHTYTHTRMDALTYFNPRTHAHAPKCPLAPFSHTRARTLRYSRQIGKDHPMSLQARDRC